MTFWAYDSVDIYGFWSSAKFELFRAWFVRFIWTRREPLQHPASNIWAPGWNEGREKKSNMSFVPFYCPVDFPFLFIDSVFYSILFYFLIYLFRYYLQSNTWIGMYIYFSSEKKKRERIRNINILTFFPSNSWVPCANTLSTLDGSPNVINPKPLQVNKAKNKRKNWLVGMFDWFMFPWCCFLRMHFKVSKKKRIKNIRNNNNNRMIITDKGRIWVDANSLNVEKGREISCSYRLYLFKMWCM